MQWTSAMVMKTNFDQPHKPMNLHQSNKSRTKNVMPDSAYSFLKLPAERACPRTGSGSVGSLSIMRCTLTCTVRPPLSAAESRTQVLHGNSDFMCNTGLCRFVPLSQRLNPAKSQGNMLTLQRMLRFKGWNVSAPSSWNTHA